MTRTLPWQKPNPAKNYYPVPKVICQLGLSPGEIAVYSFLLFCADKTFFLQRPYILAHRIAAHAHGITDGTVAGVALVGLAILTEQQE